MEIPEAYCPQLKHLQAHLPHPWPEGEMMPQRKMMQQ
jgi:hypothetical protein